MHYAGLVLDFEGLERSDLPALQRVVKAIADSAHARGVSPIVVAVPATDTTAYPGRPIATVADLVMPMLYDQHWSTSGPGPISDPDWVRSTLAARIAEVGASRIVAALPTYGYQWQAKSGRPAESVSFADAQRTVAQAGVALARDPRSNTLRAVKAGAWEIWVTDAELLSRLARDAYQVGVTRVALWRIGQEDPAVWRALGR
jgi:spore germination protein YaaH